MESFDLEGVYQPLGASGDEDEEEQACIDFNDLMLSLQEKSSRAQRPLSKSIDIDNEHQGMGVIATAVTLTKSFIGTFLLYLPHMFYEVGAAFSVGVLFVTATLSLLNMLLLIDCKEANKGDSFGAIAFQAFGPWAKILVDSSITVSQISYCVTYFVYVSQNVQEFVPECSLQTLMIFQLLVYIPLACLRHLRYLSIPVCLASVLMFAGLFGILYYIIMEISMNGVQTVKLIDCNKMFMYLGTFSVTFEGTVLVIPTYEAMKEKRHFRLLIKIVMSGLFLFYAIFSLSGYLAYGNKIERFISLNIPVGSPVGVIIKVGYIASVIVMFPLMLFPVSKLLERACFHDKKVQNHKQKCFRLTQRSGFRVVLVSGIFCAALFADVYYDRFNSVVGAICVCPLALIYPTLFYLRYFYKRMTKIHIFGLLMVLTYGILAVTSSFSVTILNWRKQ